MTHSDLLAVLVEELDHDQRSLEEAVPDVWRKTVKTAYLSWPEESPAPAPDDLLVTEPRVRHHELIWKQSSATVWTIACLAEADVTINKLVKTPLWPYRVFSTKPNFPLGFPALCRTDCANSDEIFPNYFFLSRNIELMGGSLVWNRNAEDEKQILLKLN